MLRVMIVDDNRDYKRALAKILQASFAAAIEEAPPEQDKIIEAAERFAPQVLFMDMQTLRTACFDLAEKIRKLHPDVRIIFLTSFDVKEYRDAARSCGADYCLLKNSSTPDGIVALVEFTLRELSRCEEQTAPQKKTTDLKGDK